MERSTKRAWMAAIVLMVGLGARRAGTRIPPGRCRETGLVRLARRDRSERDDIQRPGANRDRGAARHARAVAECDRPKIESAQVLQEGNRLEATAIAVGEDHLRIEPKGGADSRRDALS